VTDMLRIGLRAWCFRDGVLHFSRYLPYGALPLAMCDAETPVAAWQQRIRVRCRLGYDGVTYLVPGVPETDCPYRAADAVARFARVFLAPPESPKDQRRRMRRAQRRMHGA
jgi:hypothetical protein